MKNLVNFFIICGIALLIFTFVGYFVGLNNNTEETVIIHSTKMQQNVYDGTSETVMMVYTDKGVFEVEQEGIIARPHLVGLLNDGDTVNIKYCMFDMPVLGFYRVITNIEPYEN